MTMVRVGQSVRIRVTAGDLARGRRNDSERCALALAAARRLGGNIVSVGLTLPDVDFRRPVFTGVVIRIPDGMEKAFQCRTASAFVLAFDKRPSSRTAREKVLLRPRYFVARRVW